MKRILYFLSACAIASSVLFVSCKGDEGPQGPQGDKGDIGVSGTNGTNGTNGADGIDGVATIDSWVVDIPASSWENATFGGIGDLNFTNWGGAKVSDARISNNYVVIPYLVWNGQNVALPISTYDPTAKASTYLQYGVNTGQLNLYYRYVDNLSSTVRAAPSSTMKFEIVRIQKKAAIKMKEAGVDMKDINAVLNFGK